MRMRNDLVAGPREKAREAIKAGKTEEALKYLDQVYEQFHGLHDSYGNTQCLFMAAIAEIKGEEYLAELDKTRVFEPNREKFLKFKEMPVEERVKAICNNQRAHFNEFHVEEDDEKFVVVITGCNAGGSSDSSAGSAGISITLLASHVPSSLRFHSQMAEDRSFRFTTVLTKP